MAQHTAPESEGRSASSAPFDFDHLLGGDDARIKAAAEAGRAAAMGEAFRRLRVGCGLSQAEAARLIGTSETNRCGMELILRNTSNERLDGKKIWLEYDPSASSWQCSSEIYDKYLPVACRGKWCATACADVPA